MGKGFQTSADASHAANLRSGRAESADTHSPLCSASVPSGTPVSAVSRLQPISRRALLGWLLLGGGTALAQPTAPEYEIKATLLAKLAQYIEWPAATFAKADQPIIIGILGEDVFGPSIDASLRAFKVGGRPVQPRRLRRVEECKGCHLLYICPSEAGKLKSILSALHGQPILTVCDDESFLKHGGALRFWRNDQNIAFHINERALKEAKITANPRLLKLSVDPANPR
jgi:hypothetical protein